MKTKRIFTIITLLCLIFGMTAFADYSDVKENDPNYEAISVLTALKIIDGHPDGSFTPASPIKRSEFCAIITRFMGMGDSASGNIATDFTDVPHEHWASGYIAAATGAGLVNGVGDGKFNPDSDITYEQIVKIIVCALGYSPKADAMGGYPTGYMLVANQEAVTKGTQNHPGAVSRGIASRLLFNALSTPNMVQITFGGDQGPEYKKEEGITVLYSKMAVIKAEIEITAIEDGVASLLYLSLAEPMTYYGWSVSEDGRVVDADDNLYMTLPTEVSTEEIDASLKTATLYIDISDETGPKPLIAVETK